MKEIGNQIITLKILINPNNVEYEMSQNWNIVEKEYLIYGLIWGNTLLLPKKYAINFVKRCKDFNFKIWGVDGFEYNKDTDELQSDLGLCTDYSDENIETSFELALEFLQNQDDKYYFEIVCGK